MKITITNKTTGETINLSRDVTTSHPQWVHDQCETASEGELQEMLSAYSVDDFYSFTGAHLGADDCGISISREIKATITEQGNGLPGIGDLSGDVRSAYGEDE